MRDPRDQAQRAEMGRLVCMVQCGVRSQVPWGGEPLQGREQRRRPLLKKHGLGGVAIPTVTHHGHPTVLRDHQCQDGLFQVRAVVFGMAMGARHRLLIAVGDVLASQGEARRVKRIEAEVNPCLGADGAGDLTKQQITALGIDLIERAAERKPVEHLGAHTLTKQ